MPRVEWPLPKWNSCPLDKQIVAILHRRPVFECACLVRRNLRRLDCSGQAFDTALEVATHQPIKIVLDIATIARAAKKLEVNFILKRLGPLADQVLYEVQILLLGVAKRCA